MNTNTFSEQNSFFLQRKITGLSMFGKTAIIAEFCKGNKQVVLHYNQQLTNDKIF
jgi:hypothetical protein